MSDPQLPQEPLSDRPTEQLLSYWLNMVDTLLTTRVNDSLAEHGLTDAAPGDGHTGKVVNRYLNDPSTTDEAELRTEVYRPLG